MREISVYQVQAHWLDMDMLEVGVGSLTVHMQQTYFAFWAALKSPIIIGADLRKLSEESLEILKNKEIIALNQDSLGLPVHYEEGSTQVWAGKLEEGNFVLVFNENSYPQGVSISLKELGLGTRGRMGARELWSGKLWGCISSVETILQAYQTVVIRLT
jgi:alpha-galactosidase